MYSTQSNHFTERCPETHVYAYTTNDVGDSCCKNNMDSSDNLISLVSTTCKNNEFIACPHTECIDWGMTTRN